MATIPSFETLGYEETDGVAWVTLNRPEVYNAFNAVMQRELRTLWRALRRHDDVRVVVLTGAGDKAFCTGIDRNEALGDATGDATAGEDGEAVHVGAGTTPFMFDDPGEDLGPKTCDLWKPVIGAVNGMACGGAFYLLGEVDFIIATDQATFFDPHVTYGMAAAFEPLQMTGPMPFGELARLTLLGASERMCAQRAHQIGLVSELATDVADLRDAAGWAAGPSPTRLRWPSKARCGRCGPDGISPGARRSPSATPSSASATATRRWPRVRSGSLRAPAWSGGCAEPSGRVALLMEASGTSVPPTGTHAAFSSTRTRRQRPNRVIRRRPKYR